MKVKSLLLVCLLLVLTACGETGEPIISGAPEIITFSASPETVAEGSSSTLSWTLNGDAATLTLTNNIDNAELDLTGETSVEVSPVQTTLYSLSAENSDGSDTASTTLTVTPADTTTPTPPTPPTPTPPTEAPTISSFTASSETVEAGQEVTLAWELSGGEASFVTLDNGVGVVTGNSAAVAPEETTTYTLTVTNKGGKDTSTQTVTVTPADGSEPDPSPDPSPDPPGETPTPVIESFTASPEEIEEGESTLLSWTLNSDEGVTLTLLNDIDSSEIDLTGETSLEISPIETTVYLLAAERGDEGDAKTVIIEVTPAGTPDPEPTGAPVIESFTASPDVIEAGQSSTLTWELLGGEATSVTIDSSTGEEVEIEEGSAVVSPTATTTYTLTVENENGTDTASAILEVTGAVVVPPGGNGGTFAAVNLDATEEGEYVTILGGATIIDPAYILEEATYPAEVDPDITLTGAPANGEVSDDDGEIFYQADEGFTGTDTFEYTLSATINSEEVFASATITVSVE